MGKKLNYCISIHDDDGTFEVHVYNVDGFGKRIGKSVGYCRHIKHIDGSLFYTDDGNEFWNYHKALDYIASRIR